MQWDERQEDRLIFKVCHTSCSTWASNQVSMPMISVSSTYIVARYSFTRYFWCMFPVVISIWASSSAMYHLDVNANACSSRLMPIHGSLDNKQWIEISYESSENRELYALFDSLKMYGSNWSMDAGSSIPWKVQSWNFNVTLCSFDAVRKMSIDKTVNCLCTLQHWASLQSSEYQNLLLCFFPTAAAFVLDLTSSAFLSPSTALTNCDKKWTDNDLSRWIFMNFLSHTQHKKRAAALRIYNQ